MIVERVGPNRRGIESTVYRVRELREALGASGFRLLLGGAALGIELRELRAVGDRRCDKTIYRHYVREFVAEIEHFYRCRKIVADQDTQSAGGHDLGYAGLLDFVAPRSYLQASASVVHLGYFSGIKHQLSDPSKLFGGGETHLRGTSFRARKREPIVGIVYRLN